MPSNKSFGVVFSLVFIAVLIYGLFKSFPTYIILINIMIVLFLLVMTLFYDNKLIFLNFLWLKFGYLLSRIISPIVLSIIFFIIITPINIVSKLFGNKYLERKYNSKKTYWKDLKNKNNINFEKEY